MPDRLEVRTDLMRAPSLQSHAQQRGGRQRLLEYEMGARGPRLVGVDRHARPGAPVAAERRVDRAAARRRAALDERQVLAHDLARCERGLQPAMGLLALGNHQQPGGVLVEPVNDARAPRLAARGAVASQRLREGAVAVWAGWVHDDPRGLGDDDQLVVLVSDHQLGQFTARALLNSDQRRDRDRLTAAQAIVLAPRRAIKRHRACLDPPLRVRSRAEPLGEELVEAFAGGFRRDAQLLHHDPLPTTGSPHRT